MVDLGLVYDLRVPSMDADARARQYRTMLDQCAWADRAGFSRIAVREHHGEDDGYLPSPMLAAAGIATVTTSVTILLQALVVTLHDPVRLAEDLAVLDLMSSGRLVVVVAAGYSAEEFAMFGRSLSDRPRLVEEAVAVMRAAWTGEQFTFEGRSVRVSPLPFRDSGPPLVLGGASPAAARRGARIADGFLPVRNRHFAAYQEAVVELGRPRPADLPNAGPPFVYVSRHPDRAWEQISPYCLHESNQYGALALAAGLDTGFTPYADTDALRASGTYPVLTPAELIDLCAELGPGGQLTIPPLVGGMPPELSWASLRLFEDEVLPNIEVDRGDATTFIQSRPEPSMRTDHLIGGPRNGVDR